MVCEKTVIEIEPGVRTFSWTGYATGVFQSLCKPPNRCKIEVHPKS